MDNQALAIVGMGYVGCVSAACLASNGYRIIGVEVNHLKVEQINSGKPPIEEPGLDELFSTAVREKKIQATTELAVAIAEADILLLTVGTPPLDSGELDLSRVIKVTENFAQELIRHDKHKTLIIRSTTAPRVGVFLIRRIESISGKKHGRDFSLVVNPEFLREGSAIEDFFNPPYILIGTSSREAFNTVRGIYAEVDAESIMCSLESAEFIKYVNNSWHALKVAFANEIGSICQSTGGDTNELIDLFLKDTQLNISQRYLRPGNAYGGSCLTKDLAGLLYVARDAGVDSPLLESVSKSNESHIQRAIELIKSFDAKDIGIIGLSFKSGTDDVRESPSVHIASALKAEGYNLKIFDDSVSGSLANRASSEGLRAQLCGLDQDLVANIHDLADSGLLVIATHDVKMGLIKELIGEKPVVDLVNLKAAEGFELVKGLAW